jgi:hypothetical protein
MSYNIIVKSTSDWARLVIDAQDPARWVVDSGLDFTSSLAQSANMSVSADGKGLFIGQKQYETQPLFCRIQLQTPNSFFSFQSTKGSLGVVTIQDDVDERVNSTSGTGTNPVEFTMFLIGAALDEEQSRLAKAGQPLLQIRGNPRLV